MSTAPARAAEEDGLARLESARTRNPDDPDLAWALARELARRGRDAEAAEALRTFLQRWPGHRPEADLLLAKVEIRRGRYAEALALLEARLEAHPSDGVAHFYRGLALRGRGENEAAGESLAHAAHLASELAADALVIQGLDALAEGRRESGTRFLDAALAHEPDHELAAQARRILVEAPEGDAPPLELSVHGGLEFDSNVTLDSGLDLPGLPRDESDARAVWGGGFAWRAVERERLSMTLGYRYDESTHDHRDDYDLRGHLAFASTLLRFRRDAALRLDAELFAAQLDGDRYRRTLGLAPNLFLGLGGGLLRTWIGFEHREFYDDPLLPSLERDGVAWSGGVEHHLPFSAGPWFWVTGRRGEGGWVASGLVFERLRTDAERDLFNLDSAYDHDRWEGRVRLKLPGPGRWETLSSLSLARERYEHRNVVDLLTDDGVGTLRPDERRDTVLETRVALVRRLQEHLRLELAWRGTWRISNVDLYDYDRHVIGVYLRASTR